MKDLFIKDLILGSEVQNLIVGIREVRELTDKNSHPYIDLDLLDKSGSVKGKIWSDRFDRVSRTAIKPGKVISINGTVGDFKGQIQITILELFPAKKSSFGESDIEQLPSKDFEEMWQELGEYVNRIENSNIKELINNLLKKYGEKMKLSPAAEKLHHAYRGGLLEHILEMLGIMDSLRDEYKKVDYDQVVAGIIFHDIGKIKELEFKGFVTKRTEVGALIGHLTLSFEIFNECLPDKFPVELKMKIAHIILSHHGLLEFGSPVLPKTIEAAMVSKIDALSSTLRQYKRIIDESNENQIFSERDWALGTEVYLK